MSGWKGEKSRSLRGGRSNRGNRGNRGIAVSGGREAVPLYARPSPECSRVPEPDYDSAVDLVVGGGKLTGAWSAPRSSSTPTVQTTAFATSTTSR